MARNPRSVRKTEVRTQTVRTTRTQSKKAPAPEADVEVMLEEEGRGMTLDDAIAIVASLALLTAIVLLDAANGEYGKGIFF